MGGSQSCEWQSIPWAAVKNRLKIAKRCLLMQQTLQLWLQPPPPGPTWHAHLRKLTILPWYSQMIHLAQPLDISVVVVKYPREFDVKKAQQKVLTF